MGINELFWLVVVIGCFGVGALWSIQSEIKNLNKKINDNLENIESAVNLIEINTRK
jgi:hypothetical protein